MGESNIVYNKSELFIGSGWIWLILKNNNIYITSTTNECMILNKPLIGIDVWEHVYLLDYSNNKQKYVERMFEIINWKFAEYNLQRYL